MGLQQVGTMTSCPQVAAADEITQGAESYGMYVVGDVRAIDQYSGTELGTRWLCRIQGPFVQQVKQWPTPGNETWRYHATEAAARAMYAQLRNHAAQIAPDLRWVDTRAQNPLNVPGALSESAFRGDDEVLRLVMDNMTDLQVAVRQTNCIRKFAAHPAHQDGPQLVNYFTVNDAVRVCYAPGPSGAADHLVLIFSMEPEVIDGLVRDGMPGAIEKINHTTKPFVFPSNIAVAMWARVAGKNVLAPAQGQDPGVAIHGYLGARIAAPLHTNLLDVDRRLSGTPAAWAIRMEQGEYVARYYELNATSEGGHSFLAISRVGAPAFQPNVARKAGGMVKGGMTLEQYAAMAAERDMILMQQGANAAQPLAALCQKYGQPVPQAPYGGVNVGYAARIVDWDKAIQGDAALSAEWVVQLQAAQMKMQGIQLTQDQITAMQLQQAQVQQQLTQNAKAHQDGKVALGNAANELIEASRTASKEALVEMAKRTAPQKPSNVLYEAVRILKNPDTKGCPRYGFVDLVAQKIAEAHFLSMSPEDQKFEGKSYVKETVGDIFEKNGLQRPGLGGFLSKLVDKM